MGRADFLFMSMVGDTAFSTDCHRTEIPPCISLPFSAGG